MFNVSMTPLSPVQGLALSLALADHDLMPGVHAKKGIRSSSLVPVTTWFNGAFRQLSADEAAQKVSFSGTFCVSSAGQNIFDRYILMQLGGQEFLQ